MSYCESDPVFTVFHKQLESENPAKFEEWLKERNSTVKGMVGSGELKFPNNQDDRVRTMYWLLRQVYEGKLDVVDFSHNFFASQSRSANDRIQFFTDTVLAPLERELAYRFTDLIEAVRNTDGTVWTSEIFIFPNGGTVQKLGLADSGLDGSISSNTTNISSSLRFNAFNLIESARKYRELVRGHNQLSEEHPKRKKKYLNFYPMSSKQLLNLNR